MRRCLIRQRLSPPLPQPTQSTSVLARISIYPLDPKISFVIFQKSESHFLYQGFETSDTGLKGSLRCVFFYSFKILSIKNKSSFNLVRRCNQNIKRILQKEKLILCFHHHPNSLAVFIFLYSLPVGSSGKSFGMTHTSVQIQVHSSFSWLCDFE